MNLSNLLSTLDSQIPIAAVDVLSPDEATIIQWLTFAEVTIENLLGWFTHCCYCTSED